MAQGFISGTIEVCVPAPLPALRLVRRMQAVAQAVVKGNCLNSEAVSEVLAEVGGSFDAESTCGLTATAIQV